ncbi:MAG: FecR domain-containing protein [Pirellulaceae bacterium]|nr:FecR domain-containing protein [Pirellulaceae bacterium]
MTLTSQQLAELDSLLCELADDRLDAQGRLALEALVKSQPEAQDHYIRFMAFCSDLHDASAVALSLGEENDDESNSAEWSEEGFAQDRPGLCFPSLRWPVRAAMGAMAIAVAMVALMVWWPDPQATVPAPEGRFLMGRVEEVTGTVQIREGGLSHVQAAVGDPIRPGQYVVTRLPDALVAIRLLDGTMLMLSGDTVLAFSHDDPSQITVERGNLIADVQPRPAGRPLVICTAEANVEVLGTRLSVSREAERTRVAVLNGAIRITRLSDQREVDLQRGQAAEVSAETDLQAMPIQTVPAHWTLDFSDGLPNGWQTGQLVFDALPDGSKAAVRTSGVMENGRRRYQIRSHNAWSDGLFSLHDDSWLHIRYRVEKAGTFLIYIVCRQRDFGQPVATVLTPGNLRQTVSDQWHTVTLPLNQLHRARAEDHVLLDGQLVAFLLVFDSPEHNPGFTIDRIWVTRGEAAEPRTPIELDEACPPGGHAD